MSCKRTLSVCNPSLHAREAVVGLLLSAAQDQIMEKVAWVWVVLASLSAERRSDNRFRTPPEFYLLVILCNSSRKWLDPQERFELLYMLDRVTIPVLLKQAGCKYSYHLGESQGSSR